MGQEPVDLLPWVLGSASAIVNALFIALMAAWRGRIRDLNTALAEERENNDALRAELSECYKRRP